MQSYNREVPNFIYNEALFIQIIKSLYNNMLQSDQKVKAKNMTIEFSCDSIFHYSLFERSSRQFFIGKQSEQSFQFL